MACLGQRSGLGRLEYHHGRETGRRITDQLDQFAEAALHQPQGREDPRVVVPHRLVAGPAAERQALLHQPLGLGEPAGQQGPSGVG